MKVEQYNMIDIRGPEIVQIQVSADGHKLWVNIDGVCMLRVYEPLKIEVKDDRK